MNIKGFDKISPEIEKILTDMNISCNDAIASVKCDLLQNGKFGESYVIACKNGLYYIDKNSAFRYIDFKDIRDIVAEVYVSSGSIIVHLQDSSVLLASFTLSQNDKIEAFVNIVRKISDGKVIDNSDFIYRESFADEYINKGKKKLFFRVLSYLPRYRNSLFIMIFLIITASLINLAQPYLTGTILYDEVLTKGGKYYGKLFELIIVLVLVNALTVMLAILQGRVGAELSGKIIYDIKNEVFSSMQKLGMSFFTSKRTGNLMNRINRDSLDIQYFLNDGIPHFIINALTIMAVGLVLFIKNPLLSVSVIIPVPLIAYIIKKSTRKFKKLKWYSWRKSSSLNSIINDSFLGIRVIKAFGKEKNETDRFFAASNKLYESRYKEGIEGARVFPLLTWIMSLGGIIVWSLGGAQVLGGKLSFGELMTFTGYLTLLYNPVNFMVRAFDWWTNCMNSAQRIFEVIDRESDVPPPANPIIPEKIKGEVEFRNVTFSYEANRDVLKNVSFKVKSGEMIGLVGHSGAGKSTITNVLTRLYDVKNGEVLIDGINVKQLAPDVLRGCVSMVLQETFLFDGTIAENIAYGKPDAGIDEIIEAAKCANAHDFIVSLPEGYETRIGSNGTNLSGGEKQRISIARAVLMDSAILILDEATASLDTETEKLISEALEKLIKGRTTIAIAHRLSTLKNADSLIVVENGCVVEAGTHSELISIENGIYKKMVKAQTDALRVRNIES